MNVIERFFRRLMFKTLAMEKQYLSGLNKRFQKKEFFKNQGNTYNLPKRDVKKAIRLGFSPDEFFIYSLDKNDPQEYFSEYDRMMFRISLGSEKVILDNKVLFNVIFHDKLPMNEILQYKTNASLNVHSNDIFDAIDYLKKHSKMVYKKLSSGGGVGFHLFEYESGRFYDNRKECSERDLTDFLLSQNNYLLESYCKQSEFENHIYPYSVNTIRIVTLLHKNGEYEIGAALHRFGVDPAKCVDNACAGGIYSIIDIDNGKMTAARTHNYRLMKEKNNEFIEYSCHPVTGSRIAGEIVPNWEKIKSDVIQFHKEMLFTGLKFVAWDVALTDDGIVIIEANASCSYDFLQTWKGHKNEPIGKWMKEWGYI